MPVRELLGVYTGLLGNCPLGLAWNLGAADGRNQFLKPESGTKTDLAAVDKFS